jgi:predicted lipoprotein
MIVRRNDGLEEQVVVGINIVGAARLTILALTLLLSVSPAHAARVTTEYLVDRLVTEYIVPHYAVLTQAANDEKKAWVQFCAKPSQPGFDNVRDSYRRTADDWSAIEFIHYGTVSEEFRADRLNYWPERKNATARGL